MARALKRRIAIFLVAALALAQFGNAFACTMDRSDMAASMAMSPGHPCDGCDEMPANGQDMAPSICAVHCATSTQAAAVSAAPVLSMVRVHVFTLPPSHVRERPKGLDGPPAGAPPPRILLHSFLI